MNLKQLQINYGLIKEDNFLITMCKKWLNNTVLIYSTYNEGKSVVAERFIGTLKGKIYKKMTADDSISFE